MAKIGIIPGKPFELSKLDPAVQAALKDIPETALKKIDANKDSLGKTVNGWVITKGLGSYGPTTYLQRAVVAAFGWPANQEKDAVYPNTEVDGAGEKLTGANNYTLTFAKDATPPVNGFWSLTMYTLDGFLVPNAEHRYAIGSTHPPLVKRRDGSVVVAVQRDRPAEKDVNWLPTPPAPFRMSLRIYRPKPSVLNGAWKPPPIEPVG